MTDNTTDGSPWGAQQTLTGETPTRVGHCRKDSTTVYIGRGDGGDAHMMNTPVGERGWIGNPFTVDDHGRAECIDRFRSAFVERLENDDEFREAVSGLQGEVLGCWCQRLDDDSPACHGEIIAEWANRLGGDDA